MRLHPLTCLPILILGSCGSTSTQKLEIEPLESLEGIEFVYEGAVSLRGLPRHSWIIEDFSSGEMVRVQCRIFEVEPGSAVRMFEADHYGMRADRVDRESAERLFDELGARDAQWLTCGPTLSLHRGGRGHLSVTNEVAYIESFDLQALGDTTLGDPRVGVARDGLLIEIRTEEGEAGSPCAFGLYLDLAHLQRPIQEVTSHLPGHHTPMTIQTPIFATQRIELESRLRGTEALIVGPVPAFQGERTIMLMITAQPEEIEVEQGAQASAFFETESSQLEAVN